MKTLLALIVAVGMAGMLLAQAPAQKKAAPAASAKKEDPKGKKAEPPPKIEGQEIARKGEGYLGLMVAEGKFKLSFYDKDKKPVPPDVKSAVLRWNPSYKVGEERVVLTPGGGKNTMTAERNIRAPYHFKLFMTLLKDAAEGENPVGETYVVDFRQ